MTWSYILKYLPIDLIHKSSNLEKSMEFIQPFESPRPPSLNGRLGARLQRARQNAVHVSALSPFEDL